MSSHLKYRPDIDGLRAVAVLGVVIFHAFPKALPGGFCGVDIFFVISGYLISGILYKGLKENGGGGGFNFWEFYARRIRRLFPALITVLLLCLGYGYFVLLSDEYRQLGMHVAAGTLFIQNFVFWQESGYWDVASSLKPLLHLWSLAVEEQFYIIFPPLLLLIWKRKWPMVAILWILLGVSMIANLVMSGQDRSSDFYLTTYRAWEFLGGSLLAWWHYGKSHEEEAPYGNVLSVLGLILLATSMVLLKEKEPYPGWRAIFPVAGSIALIASGKKNWINRKILSNPAVVWIGLISYPLYLFHWPALSFVHIIKGEGLDPSYIWGALGVALLLTVATYYLIEKPIRFSKSRWTVPLLIGAFLLTGLLGMLVWRKGIHARSSPEIEKINKAITDITNPVGWNFKAKINKTVLIYDIGKGDDTTLYIGDSTLYQYAPRIAKIIREHNNSKAVLMWAGTTPPIHGCAWKSDMRKCLLMEEYEKIIANNKNLKRVVFAAYWDLFFNKKSTWEYMGQKMVEQRIWDAAFSEFGKMIAELQKKGIKVTIVSLVPNGLECDPKEYCKRTITGFTLQRPKQLTKEEFLERDSNQYIKSKLEEVAKENRADLIKPLDYLVDGNVCIVENEDGPIRYDDHHLRSGYVRDHVMFLDGTLAP
jgi:peptidoglycan/LPS O-acetylase OafA/YrhL